MFPFKQFPALGQKVFVSFYTDGLVPVGFTGRCIDLSWANEFSSFTLASQYARYQFLFFSPLVVTVQTLNEEILTKNKTHSIRSKDVFISLQQSDHRYMLRQIYDKFKQN